MGVAPFLVHPFLIIEGKNRSGSVSLDPGHSSILITVRPSLHTGRVGVPFRRDFFVRASATAVVDQLTRGTLDAGEEDYSTRLMGEVKLSIYILLLQYNLLQSGDW